MLHICIKYFHVDVFLLHLVYVLKMEYVYKINIFGQKMMMKSGLEKTFLKFLHEQSLFQKIFFTS
jgi:hypothetical protein